MSSIRFENISKSYGKSHVMENMNFKIKSQERLILLGPSGCGKSTMLRMIAGLEEISSGTLYFDDKPVNHLSAGFRDVSMVFQNYALYPHMTVEDNITYSLRAHKLDKKDIAERLKEAVAMLDLTGLEKRKPKELSGGQRQRVALARAIVKRSDNFLLDEPLSNLDAQLRHHARKELIKIHNRFNPTFIYVTHDQVEAMTLGNRIALLYEGRLQMLDTPNNIFNRPSNVFTAKFIGSPSCNTADSTYCEGHIIIGEQSVKLGDNWSELVAKSGIKNLILGLRPEHITLASEKQDNTFSGKVIHVEDYGSKSGIYFMFEGNDWVAISEESSFYPGEYIHFNLDLNKIHLFNKENSNSIGYPNNI